MNVLHINQSDKSGGAAIAGFRLHKGLLDNSLQSRMLVGHALQKDLNVQQVKGNRVVRELANTPTRYLGLNYTNIINTFFIPRLDFFRTADVVNFHNLHSGYFNYLAISRLSSLKPVVFTLHDMWAFTGHCAYSFDCDRWISGCGQCPHKDTYPKIYYDNSKLEWKLKRWIYSKSKLQIVTPSLWLAKLVKKSSLGRFPVHHIPNGMDLETYRPRDKALCRDALQIPQERFVVMFAAHGLNDPRKGSSLVPEVILRLPPDKRSNVTLLTIGKGSIDGLESSTIESMNLGFIENDSLKALAYSAADVFLFPSLSDNYPITLQESSACGTPSIAFDVGGNSEIIADGETGYLADANSPEKYLELFRLLENLYNNPETRQQMGQQCRKRSLEKFDIGTQVERYTELYRDTIVRFAK